MEKTPQVQLMQDRIRSSLGFKIVFIVILILILLVPTSFVKVLIAEREARRDEAVGEISRKWGSRQTIVGPLIVIPIRRNPSMRSRITDHAVFLPNQLDISGSVNTETRYRGIFEAILYKTQLTISGNFSRPNFEQWNLNEEEILWDRAFISIGVSDIRGIGSITEINWRGKNLKLAAGSRMSKLMPSGIHSPLKFEPEDLPDSLPFSFELDLNGISELRLSPVGSTTSVSLASNWREPSFQGAYLPNNRVINNDGFTASWNISGFNRGFPQQWIGDNQSLLRSTFGVDFIIPIDAYSQTSRSVKYAFLFLCIAFAVFFISEILSKKPLHPIQYLLVGFANCVFYLLLLSLSEHISFLCAYLIASTATTALIASYAKALFSSRYLLFAVTGALAAAYAVLYLILQAQDYALLMGSLGLFFTQAIIMYLTRNIDWFAIQEKGQAAA